MEKVGRWEQQLKERMTIEGRSQLEPRPELDESLDGRLVKLVGSLARSVPMPFLAWKDLEQKVEAGCQEENLGEV